MDIKEWVAKAPELEIGKELEQIFDKQLTCSYLPSTFNRDVSLKVSRELTTSIAKCYQLYMGILKSKANPDLFDEAQLTDYTYKFNYEFALSFSKLIDLLRTANVNTDDILNYYETLLTQLKLSDAYFQPEDILLTAMQYGRYNNIVEQVYNNPEINLRKLNLKINLPENFLKAGRIIDPVYGQILAEGCWALTYNILISDTYLPVDIEADFEKYQNQVMESWLYFFKLADLLGHDQDSMGRIYSVYYYSLNPEK